MNAITKPAPANEAAETRAEPSPRRSRRHVVGFPVALLGVILAAIAGYWWFIEGRWIESTDNAYVQGDITVLSPRIDGTSPASSSPTINGSTQTILWSNWTRPTGWHGKNRPRPPSRRRVLRSRRCMRKSPSNEPIWP